MLQVVRVHPEMIKVELLVAVLVKPSSKPLNTSEIEIETIWPSQIFQAKVHARKSSSHLPQWRRRLP